MVYLGFAIVLLVGLYLLERRRWFMPPGQTDSDKLQQLLKDEQALRTKLQADNTKLTADLATANATITQLQSQIAGSTGTGATTLSSSDSAAVDAEDAEVESELGTATDTNASGTTGTADMSASK